MFGLKILFLFGVTLALITLVNSTQEIAPGSKEFNECKKLLRKLLLKLGKGTGPNYRLGKIESLTAIGIAPALTYNFKSVVLTDKKTKETLNCKVTIRNGSNLTINCPGKKLIISK